MTELLDRSLADLLSDLPTELFASIIGTYLSLQDWSNLDRALCTRHPLRYRYLELLQSHEIPGLSIEDNDLWDARLEKGVLNWITEKGIRVVSWKNSMISMERLYTIANGLTSLQSFDISDETSRHNKYRKRVLTDAGLNAIANGRLSELKSLNISGNTMVTNDGIRAIAKNLTNLISLDMSYNWKVSDFGVIIISNCLPNLQSLKLMECPNISDDSVIVIAKNLVNLKVLDISKCDMVSDEGIEALATGYLPYLESLNIAYCSVSDDGIRFIANGNLTNLINLDISYCFMVSSDGIDALANSDNILQLQSLNMCGEARNDDDILAISMSNKLMHLQDWNINRCGITDEGVENAFLNSKLSHLNSLHLNGCWQVSTAGIIAVANRFPLLSSLHIGGQGSAFNDTGLGITMDRFIHLQLLDVSWSDNVTDSGLAAIATKLTNLKSLNLSFCRGVQSQGLVGVIGSKNLLKLKLLDLRGCVLVTNVVIGAISAETMPELRLLDVRDSGICYIKKKIAVELPLLHVVTYALLN